MQITGPPAAPCGHPEARSGTFAPYGPPVQDLLTSTPLCDSGWEGTKIAGHDAEYAIPSFLGTATVWKAVCPCFQDSAAAAGIGVQFNTLPQIA